MNFVADECVDAAVVSALRQAGHDVWYVAEQAPSVADDAVLVEANARRAVLVTDDHDFGELVYRLRRVHGGVMLLRLQRLQGQAQAAVVLEVVKRFSNELGTAFTLVEPGSVRLRRQV